MSVINAVLSFIGCLIFLLVVFFYFLYAWDKKKFCSSATVEYCDGNGSIVQIYELNGFTLYYVKKKLEIGSTVKIIDPKKIEAMNNDVEKNENFYLKLHRWKLSRMQGKGYHLVQAVCCLHEEYPQAEIKRLLDKGTAMCVDVKTGKPVVIYNIPHSLATVMNNVINYDELAMTSPIGVTELISD